MALSEIDKKRHAQLGALLKKAKFELTIEEMMAGAQAYSWLANLPYALAAAPAASANSIEPQAVPEESTTNVSNNSKRRQK